MARPIDMVHRRLGYEVFLVERYLEKGDEPELDTNWAAYNRGFEDRGRRLRIDQLRARREELHAELADKCPEFGLRKKEGA